MMEKDGEKGRAGGPFLFERSIISEISSSHESTKGLNKPFQMNREESEMMLADTEPLTECVEMRVRVLCSNCGAVRGRSDRNISRNLTRIKSESGHRSHVICVNSANGR